MKQWTIKSLYLGYTECRNGEVEMGAIPFLGFYLTDGPHKVLCDNGARTGYFKDDKSVFGFPARGDEAHLIKALDGIGVSPDEIDIVIYTHFHWDHAGNSHLFPDATHVFHEAEWKDYLDPLPSMELMGVYSDKETLSVLRKLKNPQRVAGDIDFLDGLQLLHTPGHSAGHQCLRVRTKDGHYILSGDLFGVRFCAFPDTTEWTLLDGTITQRATPDFQDFWKKAFAVTVFDHYAWHRSQIRIKAMLEAPEFLIFSHEPSQRDRTWG